MSNACSEGAIKACHPQLMFIDCKLPSSTAALVQHTCMPAPATQQIPVLALTACDSDHLAIAHLSLRLASFMKKCLPLHMSVACNALQMRARQDLWHVKPTQQLLQPCRAVQNGSARDNTRQRCHSLAKQRH